MSPGRSSSSRMVVFGGGGVGSVLAGRLALSGSPVTLVGRRDHVNAIRSDGLHLTDPGGEEMVAELTAVESLDREEWLEVGTTFLCVKSFDTVTALSQIASTGARREVPIVAMQNGVTNEEVILRFGFSPVSAAVLIGGRLLEPGRVLVPIEPSVRLGPWVGEFAPEMSAAVHQIVEQLRLAGIGAEFSSDVRSEKWAKLVRNCSNAVFVLSGLEVAQALQDFRIVECMNAVSREARDVLKAAGIRHEPVADLSLPEVKAGAARDESETIVTFRGNDTSASSGDFGSGYFGSTWDDLYRGKALTECPWFNGEIVRLAAIHRVGAPLNQFLLAASYDLSGGRRGLGELAPSALRQQMRRIAPDRFEDR